MSEQNQATTEPDENLHATNDTNELYATFLIGGYLDSAVPEDTWTYRYGYDHVTYDHQVIDHVHIETIDDTFVLVDLSPVPVEARRGFIGAKNLERVFGTMRRDGETIYCFDPDIGRAFWSGFVEGEVSDR